jgi:hypothetical protein
MQSMRQQLRTLDIKVEKYEMPKEYRMFDDFTRVTDLRRSSEVLIIGGNASFPTIRRLVADVTTVRKSGELNKLCVDGRVFDRVFIARENVLDEQLVTKAVQLAGNTGLVCFFSDDDGLREGFVEILEKNYPECEIWPLKSNVGPLVLTNAHGNPSYQD